jgi:uncharacterized membrane protein YcaP (DUF421 family)
MDIQELAMTAARTAVIYIFLLIVLRVLGKRTVGNFTPFDLTVGNFTPFDLVVAFMMSEVVDEPIFGDVPLVQGLLAITMVALLHFANSYLSFRSLTFDKLVGGEPKVVIRDGELQWDEMASERINEEELCSLLREQQVDDIQEVKRGTLETNGVLSVIKKEEAKELQKGDVQALQEVKKKREK